MRSVLRPPRRLALLLALQQLLLPLLLPLLLRPVAAVFYEQQTITANGSTYCGFYELQRYKAWCLGSFVTAWVASNKTCQGYGVCLPLESALNLTCANATFCGGRRTDLNKRGYEPEPACLVLRSLSNDTAAACDVEIDGPSIFDGPPPPAPAPPPGAPEKPWRLWKTMTIIWSILGFAAFLVTVVLLTLCCLRRRAEVANAAPVTLLSDVNKQQLETLPYGGGGPVDMTVTLRPTAPDGKPILAYGSSYPPPPSPYGTVAASPYGGNTSYPQPPATPSPLEMALGGNGGGRLPPNAGDALLRAAAASREAYNGPPLRSPLPLPPQHGLPAQGLGQGPPTTGGIATPYGTVGPYGTMGQAGSQGLAGAPGGGMTGTLGLAGAPGGGMTAGPTLTGPMMGPMMGGVDLAGAPPGPPLSPGFGPPTPPGGGGAPLLPVGGADAGGLPPVVTPAALVPPTAATLANPAGSSEATLGLQPR